MSRYIKILTIFVIILFSSCQKKAVQPNDSALVDHDNKANFVYLSTTERPTEIYLYSSTSNHPSQLTHTNGNIIDFDLNNVNGDILYSAFNYEGGADIWILPSPYEEAKLIINCRTMTCFSPQYHPDGVLITYQKSNSSFDSELIINNSEIVFYDLQNNIEINYLSFSVGNGSAPTWSSDGKYLAYFQSNPTGIRIIDFFGDEIFFIRVNNQHDFFAWGKDSDHFYFLLTEINNDQSETTIHKIQISKAEFSQIELSLNEGEMVTGLKISPDQDEVILGIRYSSFSPAQKLVVLDLITNKAKYELSDPTISAGNYSWNKTGDMIIYQKFSFDSDKKTPEIAIWNLKENLSFPIISDAYSPSFLP